MGALTRLRINFLACKTVETGGLACPFLLQRDPLWLRPVANSGIFYGSPMICESRRDGSSCVTCLRINFLACKTVETGGLAYPFLLQRDPLWLRPVVTYQKK
ncbi:hypothetical protein Nepgr_004158 [Nepenthes gracilis]|uniref:Uncharacterized protein n=1 Tax=Nepenthes gracilis TaxID=150966 RepID=A0AAD3S0Z3_NEPGR|nr:hypothetical protein Nepgr_004158 [Nepenthes gracilis]